MFVPYANSKLVPRPRAEDNGDLRLAAFVDCIQESFSAAAEKFVPSDFVLLGYADDRGVDRNGGRTGASEAPAAIREHLYKMTPAPQMSDEARAKLRIRDLGDFRSWGLKLSEAHDEARKVIARLRGQGCRTVSLGGGHDWAFADFADFMSGESPDYRHLINLDAHLDMRPLSDDPEMAAHSGTPFRRVMRTPNNPKLRMSAVGLQAHCNAAPHLKWAEGNRVTSIFLEDMPLGPDAQLSLITDRLELGDARWNFALSIDMDCFAQAFAPGVSAPQAFGLDPRVVLAMIRGLGPRLTQLGIYETNPRFDRDGATARLAARLVHEFLMSA